MMSLFIVAFCCMSLILIGRSVEGGNTLSYKPRRRVILSIGEKIKGGGRRPY